MALSYVEPNERSETAVVFSAILIPRPSKTIGVTLRRELACRFLTPANQTTNHALHGF